jgi:hypothetical protein
MEHRAGLSWQVGEAKRTGATASLFKTGEVDYVY